MANEYTPTVWKTGDIITAEKLNKIEEGIANAGQPSWETVFEGSVTTVSESEETPWAELTEVADLSADTIKVTFNGVEYTCEKQITPVGYYYGAPVEGDWTEYPFRIDINPRLSSIMTQTAGTYTLKIEAPQSGESSDFSTATVTLTNPPQGGGTVGFEQSVYISDLVGMVGGDGGFTNIESSITFVLYKGRGYANFPLKQNFAITGDIEYDQEYGDLIITGDGTITIS